MDYVGWAVLLMCLLAGGTLFFSVNAVALRKFSLVKLQDALRVAKKNSASKDLAEKLGEDSEKLILTCSLFQLISNMCILLLLVSIFPDALKAESRHAFTADSVLAFVAVALVLLVFNLALPHAWAKYAGQPPIFFPEIDLTYYQAGAHVVYTSSTTLVDPTFASLFELVYVNGDLSIQGTVSGTGTIVVDGTVTVEGDLVCSDSDVIALIAVDDILIEEPAATINAIVYGGTHGKIRLRRSSTELKLLNGVLAGDAVDSQRPLHVTHATYLDDETKEALHLPGHIS